MSVQSQPHSREFRAWVRVIPLVLGLMGLSACGGGNAGSTPPPPPPAVQQLTLSTTQINFGSPSQAGSPAPMQVTGSVSGSPAAVYAKVIYTTAGLASVSTPQVSGATATASVTAKPGSSLAPGIYKDTITVQACPDAACGTQFTGSPVVVNVTYVVGLAVSPTTIAAQAVEGNTASAPPITATYYGSSGTLTASVSYATGPGNSTGSGWLTVPAAGTSLPATLHPSIGAETAGSYGATVTLSATGAVTETSTISVRYTVSPLLQAAPINAFSVTNQQPAAGQTRSVAVTTADPSRNTAWTASVAPATTWLQLTSASGTTGSTSALGIALVPAVVAQLHNGTYTAQISIVPARAGASTIVVPVVLTLDRTQVAAVAPYVDPSGRSAQVILRGAHFDTVTIQNVQFGSVAATSWTLIDPTTIQAVHPALTAGQYPVTLTVAGAAADSSAVLLVQDAISYSAAGAANIPIQFPQWAEFDPERSSCYAASTTQVAALRATSSGWTAQTSAAKFSAISGIALGADGKTLFVADGDQIVHLDPQTLAETHRSTLSAASPNGVTRVDDGTLAFQSGGNVWAYQPWAYLDAQMYASAVLLQAVSANRTGNQLILSAVSNGTNVTIVDASSLTKSFNYVGQNATFSSIAADRFGARWAFTPLSSGLLPVVTDGAGNSLGQLPTGYYTGTALSDDGQTLVLSGTPASNVPGYQAYDLTALSGGGAATLIGSAPATFGLSATLNPELFLTPQQNEVVNCGTNTVSATVVP